MPGTLYTTGIRMISSNEGWDCARPTLTANAPSAALAEIKTLRRVIM
jgi:hypothetical protein